MQLHQIRALSQASCRFYRSAMHQVDDYNIRRIFQQRFDIYQQLLNLTASFETHDNDAEDTSLNHTIGWFEAAEQNIQNYENLIFLDFLDNHEKIALDALKVSVKQTDNELMSTQLSQFAASLQVNQDALGALKVQYRSQQAFSQPAP
ncbi:hypothetical protein [Aliidiomarina maris]|uniref:DUF2383 domain-containing protein n=1 Tax=Aliidiomarina maris TaxID=531312 RepID=A0A327WQ56_9GAMM|nr:hypothetical protein [Aliidiomarina maris]MBA3989222.1 hypothetical protein [Idiomarina sp.]MCL5049206.1 hypothetical protein [Bacillota bacterium]RAJ93558.1 hypothetical protein B0I24_1189 [Aliidiomarina maris]RUO18809.1 hypothetical protein CWE07_13560 [Aliidiomarina maris]